MIIPRQLTTQIVLLMGNVHFTQKRDMIKEEIWLKNSNILGWNVSFWSKMPQSSGSFAASQKEAVKIGIKWVSAFLSPSF